MWWTVVVAALAADLEAQTPSTSDSKRIQKILAKTPLIDGHNDVPWQVRERGDLSLERLPLDVSTADLDPPMHTDLPRLSLGRWGGVFWSVWVPPELSGPDAVLTTLEQIDIVHQMVERYPTKLALARSAEDIIRLHKQGRIASLIGIEGGHSIGSSLGALRVMYGAGARYMTLTHWQNTDFADAATDTPVHNGLTPFGEDVVREMNRIGMLVDLSHVSPDTMKDALAVTEAPVIFSHSGAFSVNPHPRNVPDDVLDLVKPNGGVVMVVFLPLFVSPEIREWHSTRAGERARLEALHIGHPDAAEAALTAWVQAHPSPRATIDQVVEHIEAVKNRIGWQHVGLGTDYDGMNDTPIGLEDVSKIDALLRALMAKGWTDEALSGLVGGNVLRVMRQAEAASTRLRATRPALPSLPRSTVPTEG